MVLLIKIKIYTLRSLLDRRSILSEQGGIFLENQLSEQAELSKQGGIILEYTLIHKSIPPYNKHIIKWLF